MQLTAIDTALLMVGGVLLTIGLFSRSLKHHLLSEVTLALLAGVIIGPDVLDLIEIGDPHPDRLLGAAAEITLAAGLMSAALNTPRARFHEQWRAFSVMLAIVTPLMWFVTTGVAVLVLDLPWRLALLLGAMLAPTDPVVANAVISGIWPSSSSPTASANC